MLGKLLKPELDELVQKKDWAGLRDAVSELHPADIGEIIEDIPAEDSVVLFRVLPRDTAAAVFGYVPVDLQSAMVTKLADEHLMAVLNEMRPDDRTRLFEELPAEVTKQVLTTLRPEELKVARQLLGYPEKSAGRRMTPKYLSIRPTMTVAEAMQYIRTHGKDRETLNVIYITDQKGFLIDDVRLGTLVLAPPDARVSTLQDIALVSIPATMPVEEVVGLFEKYDRVALPVTDSRGILVGIITIDDVLDVAEAAATEDIQRLGGTEALEAPYLDVTVWDMIKKRGGWLSILFIGEMLTATAMGYFEHEIERAAVLALFIPLIISSGGNSGSQATTLIIRSLAVREMTLKDWWRVLRRELISGLGLGVILGTLGLIRILIWPNRAALYSEHYRLVAVTVAMSLIGVVMFGTTAGSMLPFVLRRFGLDPAKASAPAVATLVDVTGLVIYFSVASIILRGTLL